MAKKTRAKNFGTLLVTNIWQIKNAFWTLASSSDKGKRHYYRSVKQIWSLLEYTSTETRHEIGEHLAKKTPPAKKFGMKLTKQNYQKDATNQHTKKHWGENTPPPKICFDLMYIHTIRVRYGENDPPFCFFHLRLNWKTCVRQKRDCVISSVDFLRKMCASAKASATLHRLSIYNPGGAVPVPLRVNTNKMSISTAPLQAPTQRKSYPRHGLGATLSKTESDGSLLFES